MEEIFKIRSHTDALANDITIYTMYYSPVQSVQIGGGLAVGHPTQLHKII